MITDLAPMDVLLQRLGRLHRHPRVRAQGFEAARVVVLTPAQRDLSPFLGQRRNRQGLGPSSDTVQGVYPNLAVLEATWAELETREALRLPTDNRALVERATHHEALEAVIDRKGWQKFHAEMEGGRLADIGRARWNAANQTGHCLDLSIPFHELPPFPDKEEDVTTRLGARDLLLSLPEGTPGAFGLATRIRVPDWLARNVPLDAAPEVVPRDTGFGLTLPHPEGPIVLDYDRWGLRKASDG
jgi:CRISPR-associated endonuclease/helicase Cas3